VVAIAGIDTRKLTRILREKGAQNGAILTGTQGNEPSEAQALELARSFPGLNGMDLAKVVSVKEAYVFTETEWKLGEGFGKQDNPQYHVVAFDYGVKRNILRMLAERGCKVTVLPAQATAADALALNPDGIFLANGPGDPAACDYAIEATARTDREGHPDLRHLPRPPDHGAGLGREDRQDEVRPPRRQPPGAGPRFEEGADHLAEPRLRGRPAPCRPTAA
jgi:carbamoyl-phosphate synthase small subunit